MDDTELYTINGMADLLRMDRATVKRVITRMQLEPDGKVGQWDGYSLESFQTALEKYQEEIGGDKPQDDTHTDRDTLINEKLRKEIERIVEDIKRKKLENQLARKSVVKVDDVYDFLRSYSDTIIDGVFGIFEQLPVDATGLNTVELRKLYDSKKKDVVLAVAKGIQNFKLQYGVTEPKKVEVKPQPEEPSI